MAPINDLCMPQLILVLLPQLDVLPIDIVSGSLVSQGHLGESMTDLGAAFAQRLRVVLGATLSALTPSFTLLKGPLGNKVRPLTVFGATAVDLCVCGGVDYSHGTFSFD